MLRRDRAAAAAAAVTQDRRHRHDEEDPEGGGRWDEESAAAAADAAIPRALRPATAKAGGPSSPKVRTLGEWNGMPPPHLYLSCR